MTFARASASSSNSKLASPASPKKRSGTVGVVPGAAGAAGVVATGVRAGWARSTRCTWACDIPKRSAVPGTRSDVSDAAAAATEAASSAAPTRLDTSACGRGRARRA